MLTQVKITPMKFSTVNVFGMFKLAARPIGAESSFVELTAFLCFIVVRSVSCSEFFLSVREGTGPTELSAPQAPVATNLSFIFNCEVFFKRLDYFN